MSPASMRRNSAIVSPSASASSPLRSSISFAITECISGPCSSAHRARPAPLQEVDKLGDGLVELGRNQLRHFHMIVHRPCQGLVLDDRDLMALGDLANLQGDEILALGND